MSTITISRPAIEFIISEYNNRNLQSYHDFCSAQNVENKLQKWHDEWKENFNADTPHMAIDNDFVSAELKFYDFSQLDYSDEDISAEEYQMAWEKWWKAFWGIHYRVFPKSLNS